MLRRRRRIVGHAVDFSTESVPARGSATSSGRSEMPVRVITQAQRSFTWTFVSPRPIEWDDSRPGEPPRYNIPKAHGDADESASEIILNEAGRGDGSTKTQNPGK